MVSTSGRDESPAQTAPEFLSSAQLCRRWHFHQESIGRMTRENRLPAVKIGNRLRFALADVEAIEAGKGLMPAPARA